ncbi:MAG: hypothetical protein ACXWUN_03480 [Allosphingosinicella sp.]
MTPRRRFALAASLSVALLGAGAMLAAQPAGEEGRRRAVGDWLVEEDFEDDGSVAIGISRVHDDDSVAYHLTVPGAGGALPSHDYLVIRLNCGQGEGEALESDRPEAPAVRARIADYLGRCEASPEEIAAVLTGFERAHSVAAGWADERAAAIGEMAMDMNMDMGSDMSMDMGTMDMNATTDMNATMDMGEHGNSIEPMEMTADELSDMGDAYENAATEPK